MSQEEKKPKVRYDRALLDEVLKRDGATLVEDGEAYEKLNRDSKIKFICSCGEEGEKTFRNCFEKYICCNVCLIKFSQKKCKKTNLEKYGVENPNQNQKIKEKTKKTNLEKYGNSCSLHGNREELIKDIILNKYGVKNVSQNTDIQKKKKEQIHL